MKRRAQTLTVLGAMAAVIGCSNNLTKEQARQILNDSYYAIEYPLLEEAGWPPPRS